ncbi:MAG TPA: DUF86 domain-containing protein [Mucilaginibacter sp.]|jgi:uncharacterized protein with HEPN domain
MSERNTDILLADIVEAIQNIFEFTKGLSFEGYCADIKTRHAVEHNFMIIGEAVARLPDDFKQTHKLVNWRQVKDFRNVIVHDYFGIDNNIVWDIIQLNLSDLLSDISQIITED